MTSASFACHGTHAVASQTRNCFLLQICRHLVHFTGPFLRPATVSCADNLDALFKWCPLSRDRHTGHMNGLVGILLGHVQGDSGDAPLHRPGQLPDTHNFLDGPYGVLMRLGSLGRQSTGKLGARKTSRLADALTYSDHSLAWRDFESQDCRGVLFDRFPILVPKVVALPHGAGPSSVRRRHEAFVVGDQNLRGPLRRVTVRLDPGVYLRPGDRETASSKTRDGANTSVKSSTATPHPQRRSAGHWREGRRPFRRGT